MAGKRVVIGMSGGVDSSVAAYLLKKAGYEVLGVTMKTWTPASESVDDPGLGGSPEVIEDAKEVAQALGISYYVVDFQRDFSDYVVDYFTQEYLEGRTPNPCVVCNRYVKWEALLNKAKELGADYIATGHYARIVCLENGRYALKTCEASAKDQTYALYNLTQAQLAHTLMPVGAYNKEEIREIASKIGLLVADKPDSQEICFIPDHDYAKFIRQRTGREVCQGNFVTADGTVVGQHRGIIHYTIGQRKGLNLSMGHPVFVREIRPRTNEVVIGDAQEVFASALRCTKINYMGVEKFEEGMELLAKIRYNHKGAPCWIEKILPDGDVICRFAQPQRAITPGQAVVFYQEGYVAAGGTIVTAVK